MQTSLPTTVYLPPSFIKSQHICLIFLSQHYITSTVKTSYLIPFSAEVILPWNIVFIISIHDCVLYYALIYH